MRRDDFEWDETKAAENRAKHGVSFEQACEAFDDPFSIAFTDDRYDYGEDRLILWYGGKPPSGRRPHMERR